LNKVKTPILSQGRWEKQMRSVCFTSQRRGKNLLFLSQGRWEKQMRSVCFTSQRRDKFYLSQGKWGRSVVRTQLLVFEQRRRAELYAKHSEAQGNLV